MDAIIDPVREACDAFIIIMKALPTSVYNMIVLALAAFFLSKVVVLVFHV